MTWGLLMTSWGAVMIFFPAEKWDSSLSVNWTCCGKGSISNSAVVLVNASLRLASFCCLSPQVGKTAANNSLPRRWQAEILLSTLRLDLTKSETSIVFFLIHTHKCDDVSPFQYLRGLAWLVPGFKWANSPETQCFQLEERKVPPFSITTSAKKVHIYISKGSAPCLEFKVCSVVMLKSSNADMRGTRSVLFTNSCVDTLPGCVRSNPYKGAQQPTL